MANAQSLQSVPIIIPKDTPSAPATNHTVAATNNVLNNKNKFESNNIPPSHTKSELISKFDNKFKENNEKMSIANRAKEEKFQELQFSAEKLHEDEQSVEKEVTNCSNGGSQQNYKNGHSNGSNGGTTPPKPLPRTSRNNSVSEQGTTPVTPAALPDDSIGRPVARPRTSASYKVPKKLNLV